MSDDIRKRAEELAEFCRYGAFSTERIESALRDERAKGLEQAAAKMADRDTANYLRRLAREVREGK